MKINILIFYLFFASLGSSLAQSGPKTSGLQPVKVVHPAWAERGNIYEVNVRQYTPEGTLNAFAKHLDRLAGDGRANAMVYAP